MKIIAAILATAIVSAAITFVTISTDNKGEVERKIEVKEDSSDQQIAELEKKLRVAEAEAGKVQIVREEIVVAGSSTESPEAILDYLSKLPMGDRNDRGGDTDEHRVLIRQVIRQFEELTSMGSDALPAIDRFLSQGLDLVLWENTSQITTRNWERGEVFLDPIFPPSLRIGLFNSVRHIGKRSGADLQECERIILKVLGTTGRSLEISYLALVLDDLSKDQHTDAYLQAAHELLIDFYDKRPKSANGLLMSLDEREVSYLDRQNKWLLWNMLRNKKDATFMDQAKKELLYEYNRTEKKDGQEVEVGYTGIDRSVLSYLTGVLGKDAMPIIRDIYETPDLGDRNRSTLRQVAANYMGVSEDASIIVNSRMNEGFAQLASLDDKKMEKENRERGLRTIGYYLGKLGEGKNVAPETLMARQNYLSSLRAQTQDKEVLAWMDNTQKQLQAMGDPEKAKNMSGRFDARRSPDNQRRGDNNRRR
ncbi:MAG TPA: hypothetical protein DEB48_00450 [Verrucomicrobiales bacterium]|nr:hypothetical protein [Verrucomicrobiales bacterium]HBU58293.1 hypothetical protein [Verrucomicrobiales bacterium]|tara:strand:- start:1192 stop:2628 length:1437 start_codon:yes stop_codon:yes gene_type:complete